MATNFGKMNFAVGFNRQSAFPLDANSYFEDYSKAVAAAKTAAEVGSSDSAYYIGQLIIVKDSAEGVGLYQISAAKDLVKFGKASSAGDLASKVSALETRATNIEGKLILASGTVDGFMSKEDFNKLKGIAAGAQINVLEGIKLGNGETSTDLVIGSDKKIDLKPTLDKYVLKDGNKVLSDNNYDDASKAIVDGVTAKLEKKVDKVEGKDLSSNDYSDTAVAEVAKIAGIDARVGVLESSITGLTGAMHFVGVSTTDPSKEAGATVTGHETFKSGDVCLFGKKEYVYNGAAWIELGDEGSHITKDEVEKNYLKITTAADTYATKVALKAVTDDYLKKADKTALEGEIALKADQTALDTTNGKVTALETKVGESTDAAKADGSLFAQVKQEVSDRKAADEALSGRITTLENAKVAVDGTTILRAEGTGILSVGAIEQSQVTGLPAALEAKAAATDVETLKSAVGTNADTAEVGTLFGKVAKAQATADAAQSKAIANEKSIETINGTLSTLDGAAVKEVQLNGTKIEPAEGGIVNIVTGELAAKDKIAEADVDSTLLAKITNYVSSVEATQMEVSEAGKLSITSISTDIIAQGEQELVLDGGKAA